MPKTDVRRCCCECYSARRGDRNRGLSTWGSQNNFSAGRCRRPNPLFAPLYPHPGPALTTATSSIAPRCRPGEVKTMPRQRPYVTFRLPSGRVGFVIISPWRPNRSILRPDPVQAVCVDRLRSRAFKAQSQASAVAAASRARRGVGPGRGPKKGGRSHKYHNLVISLLWTPKWVY